MFHEQWIYSNFQFWWRVGTVRRQFLGGVAKKVSSLTLDVDRADNMPDSRAIGGKPFFSFYD